MKKKIISTNNNAGVVRNIGRSTLIGATVEATTQFMVGGRCLSMIHARSGWKESGKTEATRERRACTIRKNIDGTTPPADYVSLTRRGGKTEEPYRNKKPTKQCLDGNAK